MNAAETLQAAIDKLEWLKASSTPGSWWASISGDVFAGPGLSDDVLVAADSRSSDAAQIVALHRTIDAQLAILRHDLEILPDYEERNLTLMWNNAVTRGGDLDLAHAILGEAS